MTDSTSSIADVSGPHSDQSLVTAGAPRGATEAVVDVVLDHVVTTFDVLRNHVVILGFSQGACIAAEYTARNPARYGGVAIFSGTLLGSRVDRDRDAGTLDDTPILVASGTKDRRVSADRTRATVDVFRSLDDLVRA